MKTNGLTIYLHGKKIGTLTNLPGDRNLFTFTEEYSEDSNRSTLSLSFKDVYGELITNIRPTQTRLPPFFSNLLPEGALRSYLANQTGVKTHREFELLNVLGRDLPGAITAIPEIDKHPSQYGAEQTTQEDQPAQHDELFHFSLAGVQLKFSAIDNDNKGLTIPANGVDGKWIVKLPDARYERVPENEYAMLSLAQVVGIHIPIIKLVKLEDLHGLPEALYQAGKQAIAVKRFDRGENSKQIHIEDFAQIFSVYSEQKYRHANYHNLASVIWRETGETGITEFIRRLTFTVLIGNGDMHLKNWSLIYPDAHTPELAPAYDFVSTIPYIRNNSLALNLSKTKAFQEIDRNAFLKLADKAKIPEKLVMNTVTETVDRFAQIWQKASHHGVEEDLETILDRHLKTLPLLQER